MPPSDVAVRAPARALGYSGGAGEATSREVAVEAPIGFVYSGRPFAVMMATPADLEDFAWGFSLTEGVVDDSADVRAVDVAPEDDGFRVSVALTGEGLMRHLGRRRALAGRTGCGLCGVEDLSQLRPAKAAAAFAEPPSGAAIGRALAGLADAQPL
ncbi:MAG: formate dehydrogenase accessory sulfurtransferase FdhD, partial [Hyphomicrobiales bacterium]|nr:formate dehydrogenase accessory sulfurtransferase FdhD [Hyphomicrobiales bacterium]